MKKILSVALVLGVVVAGGLALKSINGGGVEQQKELAINIIGG
ncbi:hypothetical protein KY997_23910 [Bacillus paralicheniformis]